MSERLALELILLSQGFVHQDDGTMIRDSVVKGMKVRDCWDGKSATFDRTVTLPGYVERLDMKIGLD